MHDKLGMRSIEVWIMLVLVAGLIFETVAIGVLAFRASDLEQRLGQKDGEVQALKAGSEAKPAVTETDAEGIPHTVVTLTAEEQNNPGYGLTPLNRMVQAAASATGNCAELGDMVNDADPNTLRINFTLEDFDKAEVQSKIADFAGSLADKDKLIADLKLAGGYKQYMPGGRLCKDATHLYAFLSSSSGAFVQPMRWNDTFYLEPYGSVLKTADLYFTFTPNAVGGRPIFGTGYGDAGHWWWSYYLPTADNTDFDRIETCKANFGYDDAAGTFKEDQMEYECSRVWKP